MLCYGVNDILGAVSSLQHTWPFVQTVNNPFKSVSIVIICIKLSSNCIYWVISFQLSKLVSFQVMTNDGELFHWKKKIISHVFSLLMFKRELGIVGPILIPFRLAALFLTDFVRSKWVSNYCPHHCRNEARRGYSALTPIFAVRLAEINV